MFLFLTIVTVNPHVRYHLGNSVSELPVSSESLTLFLFFLFVVNFVIHWNETAMGLHVFPIPIPPPTSLSTRSP